MYAVRAGPASILDFGYFFLQVCEKILSLQPLAQADEDGVVAAGDCSEYIIESEGVNGEGNRIRVSGIGFDNDERPRPVDGDVPTQEILDTAAIGFRGFIFAGEGVDIAILPIGDLANLEELEIPRKGSLGYRKGFPLQVSQEGFLRLDAVSADEFSYCLETREPLFHTDPSNNYADFLHKDTFSIGFVQAPGMLEICRIWADTDIGGYP